MTSLSESRPQAYLRPQAQAWYPADAAEFRALYQQDNPRAPEYRLEGLASMTDAEIVALADALQQAVIEAPAQIDVLWAAVCEQGRHVSTGGPA